jgi:uncharacterized protein (DUF1778 family)
MGMQLRGLTGRAACLPELPQTEVLQLSERDRAVFFERLMHPPEIHPRLRRAFAAARRLVETEGSSATTAA